MNRVGAACDQIIIFFVRRVFKINYKLNLENNRDIPNYSYFKALQATNPLIEFELFSES